MFNVAIWNENAATVGTGNIIKTAAYNISNIVKLKAIFAASFLLWLPLGSKRHELAESTLCRMFCIGMIERCLLFLFLRRSCVGTGSVLDICLERLWYELNAWILKATISFNFGYIGLWKD